MQPLTNVGSGNELVGQTPEFEFVPNMTFGMLKKRLLEIIGVSDHFALIALSDTHAQVWDELNRIEFSLGYSDAYLESDSPQLCEMRILTRSQFEECVSRIKSIFGPSSDSLEMSHKMIR